MTGVSRSSNEPVNESADHISEVDKLNHMLRTVRVRHESGLLPKEEYDNS